MEENKYTGFTVKPEELGKFKFAPQQEIKELHENLKAYSEIIKTTFQENGLGNVMHWNTTILELEKLASEEKFIKALGNFAQRSGHMLPWAAEVLNESLFDAEIINAASKFLSNDFDKLYEATDKYINSIMIAVKSNAPKKSK